MDVLLAIFGAFGLACLVIAAGVAVLSAMSDQIR